MRKIYLLALSSLFALSVASCADNKATENKVDTNATTTSLNNTTDTVFNIVGKKVDVQYPTMEAEITYTSDSTLHWKTTTDGKIEEGDEQVIYKPVGNGLYFINWIEKDGITVSQVVDFNKNIISAFMSYSDPKSERGQRSGDAFEGKLRVIE